MGTGAARLGTTSPQPILIHVRPFSSRSNSPPENRENTITCSPRDNKMTARLCTECTIELTFFKRKISCFDCGHLFCSTCATSVTAPGIQKGRRCFKCRTFAIPNRDDLMTLKIPDLKCYLTDKEISTTQCSEKRDLVDLVLQCAACQTQGLVRGSARPSSSANNSRRSDTQPRVSPSVGRTGQGNSQRRRLGGHRTSHHTHSHGSSAQGQSNSGSFSSRSHSSVDTQSQYDGRWAFLVPGAPTSSHTGNAGSQSRQSAGAPTSSHTGNAGSQSRQSGATSGSQPSTSQQGAHLSGQANRSKARVSLDELKTEEDVNKLTVRQLKEILARNFIDYKGCIERSELVERVCRLVVSHLKEKDELRKAEASGHATGTGNPTECKICMDQPVDCVLLECGHMVCCTRCGRRLHECPICRCLVSRVVRVFRS
ncbi:E3 ubiquitin-protein ligase rififylin-like [Corticium candelabrum]|uniref:E3 ubiquitin-protein ligase rififylin-like n=1 Tax=Corticium candelabrum TaxID=121492 RepID=UPI002E2571EE|nr:E3 ubiquitin-protein ligase rififylin-like [Corticium candelabrum]